MVLANLHGYTVEEECLADQDLSKRNYEQYVQARILSLRGKPVPADVNQANLPMKKSKRNWDDEARLENSI